MQIYHIYVLNDGPPVFMGSIQNYEGVIDGHPMFSSFKIICKNTVWKSEISDNSKQVVLPEKPSLQNVYVSAKFVYDRAYFSMLSQHEDCLVPDMETHLVLESSMGARLAHAQMNKIVHAPLSNKSALYYLNQDWSTLIQGHIQYHD